MSLSRWRGKMRRIMWVSNGFGILDEGNREERGLGGGE
jgi:hypothetical protein